jgi:hypothetical protein
VVVWLGVASGGQGRVDTGEIVLGTKCGGVTQLVGGVGDDHVAGVQPRPREGGEKVRSVTALVAMVNHCGAAVSGPPKICSTIPSGW